MRKLLYFVLVFTLSHSAWADTSQKPPELGAYIQTSQPYGQGKLTKLWFYIYDASLWTDAPQWSMQEPFALSLRYGRSFDGGNIAVRSLQEIQNVSKPTQQELASYKQQMNNLFPDVHKNDVITAIYLPKQGIRFFYNGTPTGSITDMVFAQRFMLIWLSPQTSEPELRKQLLNKSSPQTHASNE